MAIKPPPFPSRKTPGKPCDLRHMRIESDPAGSSVPCSVEHYSLMTPWPADGKPGKCWGAKCSAFAPVNDGWGYCLFHQAIRLMVNDAKRGNEDVRRVLEKLGVKP